MEVLGVCTEGLWVPRSLWQQVDDYRKWNQGKKTGWEAIELVGIEV